MAYFTNLYLFGVLWVLPRIPSKSNLKFSLKQVSKLLLRVPGSILGCSLTERFARGEIVLCRDEVARKCHGLRDNDKKGMILIELHFSVIARYVTSNM